MVWHDVNTLKISNHWWGCTPKTDSKIHLGIILNYGDFSRHAIIISVQLFFDFLFHVNSSFYYLFIKLAWSLTIIVKLDWRKDTTNNVLNMLLLSKVSCWLLYYIHVYTVLYAYSHTFWLVAIVNTTKINLITSNEYYSCQCIYVTANLWNQPFHEMANIFSLFVKWLIHSATSWNS